MIKNISVDELKWLCLEYIKKGNSAVIYLESKKVSLGSVFLSFDEAANKIQKDLNLYTHTRQ